MLLATFQDQRVYEGSGYTLNALYPMPSISKLVVDNPPQSGLEIFGNPHFTMPPLFREDSFDPTSRLRRGRFYVYGGFRQFNPAQVSHFPYGPPTGGQPPSYDMNVYDSLQPTGAVRSGRILIFLGDVNHKTAWRIIGIERQYNSESMFVLLSANSLSILPDLDGTKIPPGSRPQVEEGLEKVADAANKYLPEAVVDVCREFARVIIAAWLSTIGIKAKGDLSNVSAQIPDREWPIVQSAGKTLARLHSRAKSSEQERQASKGHDLRLVSQEDADLSLSLIACLLREFRWSV